MAKSSFCEEAVSGLRRNRALYRVSRFLWRTLRGGAISFLRAVSPRTSFRGMPKGTFSLAKQVRSGKIEGGMFFERQDVPDFGPDSLVKRAGLNQDGFQPWPVFWAKVEQARLVGPNSLLLDEKKRACAEAMFGADYSRFDASFNRFNLSRPQLLKGNWTSLPGRLDAGYWHFLLDTLPRLHALPGFPPDTHILIRPNAAPWQLEIFEMLGLADRVIEMDFQCVEIEHYYFSSFTSMTGAWNPFAVRFLRDVLMSHATCSAEAGEKLYLRRGARWSRGIVNEDEVCAFFESRGWRVVAPETLPVREQIGLFRDAKAICSVHGSALTNLLWVSPGTKVLELVADTFILGSFEWLARCVDAEHYFLVFPGDHRLSLTVDLSRLCEAVDRFFK